MNGGPRGGLVFFLRLVLNLHDVLIMLEVQFGHEGGSEVSREVALMRRHLCRLKQ